MASERPGPEAADGTGYVVEAGRRPAALALLWSRRGVLLSLWLRDVHVRYRQAALGALWALAQPLALMAVTTAVFHGMLGVAPGGEDGGTTSYALFVLTGLVPFTFFQTAVTAAVPSLVSDASLVRKIFFPREAVPLAAVGAAGIDLVLGIGLWLLAVVLVGSGPTLSWLLVPVLLLILVATAAAVALLGAAINVYLRDVKHAIPLLLQVLFFATPIVYPLTAASAGRVMWCVNPLTGVVLGLRRIGLEGRPPALLETGVSALVAAALLGIAYSFFTRAASRFADVV